MNKIQHINTYVFGLALVLGLFTASLLEAQVNLKSALIDLGYLESEIDTGGVYNMPTDEEWYRANYWGPGIYGLVLPKTIAYSYLQVQVRGADGGTFDNNSSDITLFGGEGATATAYFKIGSGTGEIQPGATLRFIIGESSSGSYSNGGGGTGLAYQNPETGEWSMLAVAGGGGGAGSSTDGVPGQDTEDGSPGRGYGGNGGSDGKSGEDNSGSYSAAGAPGIGYKDSMEEVDTDDNEEIDELIGSDATQELNTDDNEDIDEHDEPIGSKDATWGFGGGGKRNRPSSGVGDWSGGGGGGYSGGGGGKRLTYSGGGGGGGGSFVNASLAIESLVFKNNTTDNPREGFVEFRFTDDPTLEDEIQSAAASDKCLDLYKGITDNETNIQLYECTGRSPQQWVIDGLYIRLAKDLDKCVDLNQSNSAVYLYDCQYEINQQWIYDGLSGTFRSAVYPKEACLGLLNGSTANDTDVQVIPCTGDNITLTQQWRIDGATLVDSKSGVKTIHLASKTDMCLDLYKGITDNTTSNVQLYQCTGRSPQQWVFDGLRIKYNQDQDKCVNLNGGDTSNGTNIKVRDCYDPDDKARQHWIYDGLTQSFRSAVDPSKCLQVEHEEVEEDATSDSGSNEDDTSDDELFGNDSNVELSDCDGSDAQRWVIEG